MMGFLIIDDHPLFGEALGNAIRISHPDARIYEATSIKGALGILASEPNIDLALLDLLLPDVVGFSGFQKIRDRHPRLPMWRFGRFHVHDLVTPSQPHLDIIGNLWV